MTFALQSTAGKKVMQGDQHLWSTGEDELRKPNQRMREPEWGKTKVGDGGEVRGEQIRKAFDHADWEGGRVVGGGQA